MNDQDMERLAWLLDHYSQPYTQSIEKLKEYRRRFPGGRLPNKPRPDGTGEWEGPFFCRMIDELITEVTRKSLRQKLAAWLKKKIPFRDDRGQERRQESLRHVVEVEDSRERC